MVHSKSISILLADDDPDDLELIQDALLLQQPGLELHSVDCGTKVLSFLSRLDDGTLPTLIILDYNMPDLTAPQILAALKSMHRYDAIVKVILSTSNAPAFIYECKQAGAFDYFVKPSDLTELSTIAWRILGIATLAQG